MARQVSFEPVKTAYGWQVNIPAQYSETGKRQRQYFATKSEAQGKSAQLSTLKENHGTGFRHLDPLKQREAAQVYRLIEEAGVTTPLPLIVSQHIERMKKSAASLPFSEAFDLFVASKPRRPAYKIALDSLRKIAAPIHSKLLRDITG
ncbi:MAG TPA: hypothetical protein PLS03_16590, partial [Terrimicrobiaceae bacterium]|nr:hypothetical protein [Terrimicrobiaceae bacterium]